MGDESSLVSSSVKKGASFRLRINSRQKMYASVSIRVTPSPAVGMLPLSLEPFHLNPRGLAKRDHVANIDMTVMTT